MQFITISYKGPSPSETVTLALHDALPISGLTVAVTTTPLWLTGLPLASSSWSTGCWANATPLCAALDGAVVKATRPAAPAVPSAVNVTGLPVSPLDAAVSGLVPAVRSGERRAGEGVRATWRV